MIVASMLMAIACASGVDIKPTGTGRLDIEARGATVMDVLECLTDRTGLKVVNTTRVAPTRPITLSLHGKTEAEIVTEVLNEGRVNFGLTTDRDGGRVKVLLLTGLRGPAPASSPATSGPSRSSFTPGNAPAPYQAGIDEEPPPLPEPPQPGPPMSRPNDFAPQNPGPTYQPPLPSPEPYPQTHSLSPTSLRDGGRIPNRAKP